VAKRTEKPFIDLEDFCERVDPKIVGKRVFESLIMAGALDCFGHDRASMMAGMERMMGLASRAMRMLPWASWICSAPPAGRARSSSICRPPNLAARRPAAPRVSGRRLLSLGASARRIQDRAGKIACAELGRLLRRGEARRDGRPSGWHGDLKQERKTRTGNKMGVVNFSDNSGQYEAVLFAETLAQFAISWSPAGR
jgi:DNA polymerase-3 subunit alpha